MRLLSEQGRRRERWALLVIVVVSLVLRVALIRADRVVRWDEPDYLILSRHLFSGQGYTVSGRPELHYAPLFPIAAGLLYPLTHDMKLNSDIWFVLFGTLALLPFYWLARRLFGTRVAIVATVLMSVFPALTGAVLFWGTMVEPLYLLLVYAALCTVWLAWEEGSARWYVASGALFGLAYLTKPEAVVYFGWMFGLLLVANLWRGSRSNRRLAVSLLGSVVAFVLVVSPYIAFLYRHTGRIMISGKLGVTYVAGQGAVDHDPGLYDRALSQLDAAGEEIIWFSPDRFKYSVWDVIKADPQGFLRRTWQNVNTLERMLFARQVFPFYLLLLMSLGWFFSPWNKDRAVKELFVLAAVVPVLIFLPFHIELRYFAPLLPMLLLWLAKGIDAWSQWMSQTWADLRPGPAGAQGGAVRWAIALTCVLLAFFAVLQPLVMREGLAGMNTSRRDVGLWLKDHTDPQSLIMSRDTEVPFYAERPWAASPNEEYPRFIAYVRYRGADYLVVDEREATVIRPQLRLLLDTESPPSGLRHVYSANDALGRTIVYEVVD